MSAPDFSHRAAWPALAPHAIRYCDTDMQGHVNNVSYAAYFEFGRTEFIHRYAPDLIEPGCGMILARIEIDFRAELHFPQPIDIGFAVLSVGGSSVKLAQSVFTGEKLVASGLSVMVQMDQASNRPRPWSPAQRGVLERWGFRPTA